MESAKKLTGNIFLQEYRQISRKLNCFYDAVRLSYGKQKTSTEDCDALNNLMLCKMMLFVFNQPLVFGTRVTRIRNLLLEVELSNGSLGMVYSIDFNPGEILQ